MIPSLFCSKIKKDIFFCSVKSFGLLDPSVDFTYNKI